MPAARDPPTNPFQPDLPGEILYIDHDTFLMEDAADYITEP
jgi:hypothetical protein